MKRGKILERARHLVDRERNATHGDAAENFARIASGWDWWLSIRAAGPLRSHDVACLMAVFKLARMAGNPAHVDSAVDLCGYGALAGEIGADMPRPGLGSATARDMPFGVPANRQRSTVRVVANHPGAPKA